MHEKTGADVFVRPVIVFNKFKEVKFGTEPLKKVYVVGKPWLKNLIEGFRKSDFSVDRSIIEEALSGVN